MADHGKEIVAVDDSSLILRMLERVLGKQYFLYAFADGDRALELLKKKAPALIILDIDMPELSGFDMLEMIRQMDHLKNVPVIFLTSNNDKNYVVKAVARGANDYVVKPLDENILLKKIDGLIR